MRRCGTKVDKHWFLTVHEVCYLMNFDCVQIGIISNDTTIIEIVND